MSTGMDRVPGIEIPELDGSFATPVMAIKGKAIGGVISSEAQTFQILVGFVPGQMVPLEIDGADAELVAPAVKGVLLPPDVFAFHYIQLVGTAPAVVEFGTKS